MSLIVDEHRQYLSDQNRLGAFELAINEVVNPGSVVVDLGAGSGIMGLMACRAGARKVYSIEETSLIGLTRDIARANGFQDRITFIKDLSIHARLPELADVVVADQIGRFGFDAGIFEYFRDARRRFLRPKGVLVPSSIDLVVAPIERQDLWRDVDFWSQARAGFNFLPARKLAANTGYPAELQSPDLLASPRVVASLETGGCPDSLADLEASMKLERAGTIHGFGGWFSAHLSPHVTMSNGPLDPRRIKRRNVFFPIDQPVTVKKGDSVRIGMTIRPGESVVAWTVDVQPGTVGKGSTRTGRARFSHSTFQGMLLCREDLERAHPAFVPTLTPRGEARRTILELCDGRRPLAAIEQEVFRRHPQLFASQSEAATFVAEVVSRYSH